MSDDDRGELLAFLLAQGTEQLCVTSGIRSRYATVGKRARTATLADRFGRTTVLKSLRLFAAEGLLLQTKGGRHAGWSLTELGVRVARDWAADDDIANGRTVTFAELRSRRESRTAGRHA